MKTVLEIYSDGSANYHGVPVNEDSPMYILEEIARVIDSGVRWHNKLIRGRSSSVGWGLGDYLTGLSKPTPPTVTIVYEANDGKWQAVYLDDRIAWYGETPTGTVPPWFDSLLTKMGAKYAYLIAPVGLEFRSLPRSLAGYRRMLGEREIAALRAKQKGLDAEIRQIEGQINRLTAANG